MAGFELNKCSVAFLRPSTVECLAIQLNPTKHLLTRANRPGEKRRLRYMVTNRQGQQIYELAIYKKIVIFKQVQIFLEPNLCHGKSAPFLIKFYFIPLL